MFLCFYLINTVKAKPTFFLVLCYLTLCPFNDIVYCSHETIGTDIAIQRILFTLLLADLVDFCSFPSSNLDLMILPNTAFEFY